MDLNATLGYEDTQQDSIWMRPVSRNIEKCSHFKRNSKVDPGRMAGFPPLELYIRIWANGICNWLVVQIRIYGYSLDTP